MNACILKANFQFVNFLLLVITFGCTGVGIAMFLRRERKDLAAGLYFDDASYYYLVLSRSGGRFDVVDSLCGRFPAVLLERSAPFFDSGSGIDEFFSFFVSVSGGYDIPVNFAIQPQDSLIRIIAMPGLTKDEAQKAFRYEMENYFPFTTDDGVYDLAEIGFPLENGVTERRFVVSAARRKLIENISNAAWSKGVRLASIEPAQIALERSISQETAMPEGCVYMYIGHNCSVIVFLWKGCGVFYRNVPFVLDTLSSAGAADVFIKGSLSAFSDAPSWNGCSGGNLCYVFGPGKFSVPLDLLKKELPYVEFVLTSPTCTGKTNFPALGEWEPALGAALR